MGASERPAPEAPAPIGCPMRAEFPCVTRDSPRPVPQGRRMPARPHRDGHPVASFGPSRHCLLALPLIGPMVAGVRQPPGAPSHWPHGCRCPARPSPAHSLLPPRSPASAISPVETVRRAQSAARSLVGRVLFPYPAPPPTLISFCDLPSNRALSPPHWPLPQRLSSSITSYVRPPCCDAQHHFPTRPRLRTRSSLAAFASQLPPQCTRLPPPTARELLRILAFPMLVTRGRRPVRPLPDTEPTIRRHNEPCFTPSTQGWWSSPGFSLSSDTLDHLRSRSTCPACLSTPISPSPISRSPNLDCVAATGSFRGSRVYHSQAPAR